MFQLRFLIGSPRRLSAHIFCHRNFRGQRTGPDDFHPEFKTFVCQPSEGRTSYQLMLELMRHAADHQVGSQLFPIVELWDPETGVRAKLDGTEVILRRSDIDAAEAMMADKGVLPEVNLEQSDAQGEAVAPVATPAADPLQNMLETNIIRILSDGESNKMTAQMLADRLGTDPSVIKTTVADSAKLQNKGGWISVLAN